MKIITETIDETFLENSNEFLKKNKDNIIIFDIETTGLSHKNNSIMLIGIMYRKDFKTYISQFFCEKLEEEKLILEKFLSFIKDYDFFISFNGNSFDIPFINKRLDHHNIKGFINKAFNIDLLKIGKIMAKNSLIENYKLKTVESFIGIERSDLISGKESIELYFQFLRTKSLEIRETILLHNFEDIKNLSKLSQITNFNYTNDSIFYFPIMFLFKKNRYYYVIESSTLKNDFVELHIVSRDFSRNYEFYYNNGGFIKQIEHNIYIKLPVFRITVESEIYTIIDIDSIDEYEKSFNDLEFSEKKHLVFLTNNHFDFSNITDFLKKFILYESN